ncbi:MAG TPA: FAD-dependent monooxygenase [Candidatus Paceibacterota bacterium]|jgi:2-polyprenyl-6-methoxyphenol hydroxylase-like FAD-dependent oxidoreductase|nr:FAD-dependent monooxygenase [Candidatus Paceibacterota bacterium]
MRVLISGGGIAGVALAYFLQKDHAVTIVEKASHWRTIGLAVGIWTNGLKILDDLPLSKEFKASAFPVHAGAGLSAQGETLFQIPFDRPDMTTHTFERDALHRALTDLLEGPLVRFNTTIMSILQLESSVEVSFSDGTKDTFDLVVGADGVHSKVRELTFGAHVLHDYGWNGLGAWISPSSPHFPGYYILCTAGESILSLPYRDKQAVGLLYKSSDPAWPKKPATPEEVLERFPTLRDKIEKIAHSIENFDSMIYGKMQYPKLREWHRGRVVVVGDAKHAMTPLTGAGTSFALEDALVLSQEVNLHPLPDALANFAARRDRRMRQAAPFCNTIEALGMVNTPLREKVNNFALQHMPDAVPNLMFKMMFDASL